MTLKVGRDEAIDSYQAEPHIASFPKRWTNKTMQHGDFVWCDLSARNLDTICEFYSGLFGWNYHSGQGPDGSGYTVAYKNHTPMAGLYAMPQKFQDMGMPSFWMSYIYVDDVDQVVRKATKLGGKIELGPLGAANYGTVALIRDPLGAGFTVVSGGELTVRSERPAHGQLAWNCLFVSDAHAVIPFYEQLFGWTVTQSPSDRDRFDVSLEGRSISEISTLDQSIRGKEQFWGVLFCCARFSKGAEIRRDERHELVRRRSDNPRARHRQCCVLLDLREPIISALDEFLKLHWPAIAQDQVRHGIALSIFKLAATKPDSGVAFWSLGGPRNCVRPHS